MKNRKLKIGILAVIITAVVLVVAAFALTKSNSNPEEGIIKDLTTGTNSELTVGFITQGSLTDKANGAIYKGLTKANEALGASVTTEENADDVTAFLKKMGDEKKTLVIVNGGAFGEATKAEAQLYKETKFIVIDGDVENGENLGSIQSDYGEVGFIQGVLATLLTEHNIIGSLAEESSPSLETVEMAFTGGSNYINPDVRLMNTVNDRDGSMDEIMTLMGASGVDVLTAFGSENFQTNILKMAKEKDIKLIGSNVNIEENKAYVMASVNLMLGDVVYGVVENAKEGIFEGTIQSAGVKNNGINVTYSPAFNKQITDAVKNKVNEVIENIKSGEIDINSYLVW